MPDDLKFTAAEWRRQQAVDLFNFTWTLIGQPDRTSAADDLMIRSAHASRYHWSIAGNVANYLRGDWATSAKPGNSIGWPKPPDTTSPNPTIANSSSVL
jgi:hypothetical protein